MIYRRRMHRGTGVPRALMYRLACAVKKVVRPLGIVTSAVVGCENFSAMQVLIVSQNSCTILPEIVCVL
jgi:hypothetical protein